ncbi:putative histone-like DNA-binding protein [Parabacteroides sp. PF5-5]|uniref:HU family DNA-binding protein n=1 Tax=unclassified Parabacteroides TaxID=2649774 RepID=UPI0024741842|nr:MULTISPECIES: HU family DNA-binding protein [unclassified Parabacteroides]MDH6303926.1 putative histone-like DNA-binding protein [Parabacteroides sp. PH5-39]MDH6314543.1 putative histone-like DNA-binding protein [Parabacteroides sp. PF5-13]MDH6318392.1 putative histone-like DNA-binding protein [Parabacteroides sp. PH5-13]MDH6322315.1 putative histone-like DNA-binding protein [Parabacteroides sp. PH5-8]MDH6325605.1 putative histone-like DNA-binding protein [Parabacteroides sp. PH5-41]
MAILYKPRKMVCAIPGKKKTGYFAGKVTGNTIDTNDLCKRISDKCSITAADVMGVVEALIKEMELELLSGSNIQVGDLGYFSASITSKIVDNKDDLKPKKVRVKTITYLPSVRLKKIMRTAKFMRLRDFNRIFNGIDEE